MEKIVGQNKEVIKGTLSSAAVLLVSTGTAISFDTDKQWVGLAMAALGVICIFGREILKRYEK